MYERVKNRVGIFIPVYFREDLAKKCLLSLLRTNFNKLSVYLYIGINGASKDFKNNFLVDYMRENNGKKFAHIGVWNLNKNEGKPKIINEMVSNASCEIDYVVSMDSDMVTIDSMWLLNFIRVFHEYRQYNPDTRPLGALCANQTGHNVHLVKTMPGHFNLKVGDFTLWSTPHNDGVAGGVLMTPLNVWNHLKGYSAHNIYGSDDGHYVRDCDLKGLLMAYVDEIKLYHPMNKDMEYADWKQRAAHNKLKEEERNGFFETLRGK